MDITWGIESHHLAWHWLIAVYLFLAGVSGGAFLTSALTDLFAKNKSQKIIKAGAFIAPIVIVVGLGLLVVDLGRPFAFWKLLIHVNFGSVMSIGVFIISIFSALTVGYAYLVWQADVASAKIEISGARRETAASAPAKKDIAIAAMSGQEAVSGKGLQAFRKPIALLGSLFALGTATYTGFLLSDVSTNELWATPFLGMDSIPFLPILFLVSASSAGLAATLLFAKNSDDISVYKKVDLALIAVEIILIALLFFSVNSIFFSGSMGILFWLGVVAIGLLLPLLLTIYSVSTHNNLLFPISSMILIGGLSLRWFIVYSGQMFR